MNKGKISVTKAFDEEGGEDDVLSEPTLRREEHRIDI